MLSYQMFAVDVAADVVAVNVIAEIVVVVVAEYELGVDDEFGVVAVAVDVVGGIEH